MLCQRVRDQFVVMSRGKRSSVVMSRGRRLMCCFVKVVRDWCVVLSRGNRSIRRYVKG